MLLQRCSALAVPEQLPDIVAQSVLLAVSILLLLLAYNEDIFKRRPWLLYVFSFVTAFTLEAIDVGLVTYHSLNPDEGEEESPRPTKPWYLPSLLSVNLL